MNARMTTAVFVLAAAPALAQTARSGVSNPDPVVITASPDDTAPAASTSAKPSAAIPVPQAAPATAAPQGEVYGSYVPYKGTAQTEDSAAVVTNPDAEIVTSVPDRAGELREGTLLHVHMQEGLSTATTVQGTKFTAELQEPVEKDGVVILPVGSLLEGTVTEVHTGRRITGAAALHLETRSVTLPDGTHYVVHAQLIDTSKSQFKVDREGTLVRKENVKENIAAMSLATGGGAVAGAMIGGGVGAVVGAGVGAGLSTVLWLKQDRQATLSKDVDLVFSLTVPMILKPLSNGPIDSARLHNDGTMGAAQ
jgi:hypothetical protein